MKIKNDSPWPSIIGIAVCIAGLLLFALWAGAHIDLVGFKQANSVSISDAQVVTPTIEPTAQPTHAPTVTVMPTPEITPTTVIIQLAPIVARRTFKITAFCACVICCDKTDGITFSGAHVTEGLTCAADLSVLPLGTVVDIEGIGLRTVQDKSSKVKGDHIDFYMKSHADALKFGEQYRMVTIFEKEDTK